MRIVLLVLLLSGLVLAQDNAVVRLHTEPDGVDVYMQDSSGRGLYLGRSDQALVFEDRYTSGRGSVDLRLEKEGYYPLTYNVKVLSLTDGAELGLDEPIRLPPKADPGSYLAVAGGGLLLSLGLAYLTKSRKPKLEDLRETTTSSDEGELDSMIGRDLLGYKLVEVVGQGGMGTVYRALGESGEEAAVKLIDQTSLKESLRERLSRELTTASKLRHPGLVQTWDYQVVDKERFLVILMEWLPGQSLERHAETGVLSMQDCLRLMKPAFDALAFLHGKGIVHRDIKPSNIIVLSEESVKLIDFGLAKDLGQDALTRSGMMIGTPRYMAPEQILAAGSVGPAADQYSLGLIVYELVAGRPPFDSDDPVKLIYHHLEDDPPFISDFNPAVSDAFSACVARMLERDPARRFPAVSDALRALEQAL